MAVRSLASAAGAVRPPAGDTMVISGPGTTAGTRPRITHRVAVPIPPRNMS